jgi:uncharacterized protein YaiI (UPF0178 family)
VSEEETDVSVFESMGMAVVVVAEESPLAVVALEPRVVASVVADEPDVAETELVPVSPVDELVVVTDGIELHLAFDCSLG